MGAATAPAGGQPVANQVMPHVVAATDPPGLLPMLLRRSALANQVSGRRSCGEPRASGRRPHRPAEANSAAAVTSPVLASGYAVQVTSERSESSAQAAFRVLQAKYPQQLGDRQLKLLPGKKIELILEPMDHK